MTKRQLWKQCILCIYAPTAPQNRAIPQQRLVIPGNRQYPDQELTVGNKVDSSSRNINTSCIGSHSDSTVSSKLSHPQPFLRVQGGWLIRTQSLSIKVGRELFAYSLPLGSRTPKVGGTRRLVPPHSPDNPSQSLRLGVCDSFNIIFFQLRNESRPAHGVDAHGARDLLAPLPEPLGGPHHPGQRPGEPRVVLHARPAAVGRALVAEIVGDGGRPRQQRSRQWGCRVARAARIKRGSHYTVV